MSPRTRFLLPLFVLVALLVLSTTAAAHDRSGPKVVASGLDNPRGLDVGKWGDVYVAEAGRGGDGEDGACLTGPEGDQVCAGATGAITRIWHGHQRRVVTGLPSLADPATGGEGALGPHDIALRHFGRAYVTVGLGADPAVRKDLGPLGPDFGRLYKVSLFGRVRSVADISAFETEENPDGGERDSNPFSVATGWGRTAVTDAGGNSLLHVRRDGSISTLAVFPDRLVPAPGGTEEMPMQSVPTGVVEGPDGAYYNTELTGFPFVPGAARIHRTVPGSDSEVYAEGFTNAIDLAFDRHGNLYVLEIATNGFLSEDPTGGLWKVAPDGSRELVMSEGLVAPSGIAIGHRGEIYVSNNGTSAGEGEVLRIKGKRGHGHGHGHH